MVFVTVQNLNGTDGAFSIICKFNILIIVSEQFLNSTLAHYRLFSAINDE